MWNNIFVIWKFLYLFILWFRFYLIDLTVYILLCHEIASLNFISNEENPIPIGVPFLVFILTSYLLQPTTYLTEKKRKKKKRKKFQILHQNGPFHGPVQQKAMAFLRFSHSGL